MLEYKNQIPPIKNKNTKAKSIVASLALCLAKALMVWFLRLT
jgi:hypothetical protein